MKETEKLAQKQIANDVYQALKKQIAYDDIIVEYPKERRLGDLAVPCFVFAKVLKKSPAEIAQEIKNNLTGEYRQVEIVGGYLNFFLQREDLTKQVLMVATKKDYGKLSFGKDKTVVIDYSSPNIAKPFSVGNLRSTVIGNSLRKICLKCGYKVIGINHLGDWGTQFGKLIAAYKKWGDPEKVRANPVDELTALYVRFHEEAKQDDTLEEKGRYYFRQLELGDQECVELWHWFRDESLKEFEKTYRLLGINNFDRYDGEAFYNDKMAPIINELQEKNLLEKSEGAQVVKFDELPPALIQKKDGATLYITRELATAFYRQKTYCFSEALYVVGNEQQLHFQQLKEIIKQMNYDFANNIFHVNFGLILQGGRKMSARDGGTIKLHDVLEEAIARVGSYTDDYELKRKIGIGAVIFNDLKNYRTHDVEFNLDEILRFEGETGPYVQYTYARIQSLLTNKKDLEINMGKIKINDLIWYLVFKISNFSNIIEKAKKDYDPSLLAKYVLSLTQDFNKFYGEERIVEEDEQYSQFKLLVCQAVGNVIKESLSLLGVEAPEKM